MHRLNAVLSSFPPRRELAKDRTVLGNHVSGVPEGPTRRKPQCYTEYRENTAIIYVNNPPVNALSSYVIEDIQDNLKTALSNTRTDSIVICGCRNTFIAGADISQFGSRPQDSAGETLSPLVTLLANIENCELPVVAAIEKFALGGGLELASACHARVATPNSKIGLPELDLGIIPGAGGTQRVPRLCGPALALKMMLTSSPISSQEGARSGIIDRVVSSEDLLSTAVDMARSLRGQRLRRSSQISLDQTLALEAVSHARRRYVKDELRMPHLWLCVNAVEHGIRYGAVEGMKEEAAAFRKLEHRPSAKSLIHLFFAKRAAAKVQRAPHSPLQLPHPPRTVAVVGGGLMGSGIASAFLMNGLQVLVKEVSPAAVEHAHSTISSIVTRSAKRRADPGKMVSDCLARLRTQTTWEGFASADIAIEAVIEKMSLKQEIFKDLERVCNGQCLLLTNTSTMDILSIGALTSAQGRIAGMHFFSPAHVMPLVEIIETQATDASVIAYLVQVVKNGLKKVPVVAKNCVGFAVNRMFFPYGQCAAFLLEQCHTDPYVIDSALEQFGMPMGPFKMQDLSGIDVAAFIGPIFRAAYPDRTYQSHISELMSNAGRKGQKTGGGFYRYEPRDGRLLTQYAHYDIGPFLDEAANLASGTGRSLPYLELTPTEIANALLYPVVNEAVRVLEEGVVARASDLDVASVLGYGFPKYRGGVMHWAEQIGFAHIVKSLEEFEQRFKHPIFAPSDALKRRAAII